MFSLELTRVQQWLLVVCATVVLMVAVGGATRLTQSGLSMVDWKPISGILPPMSKSAWQAEFNKYKQYPEYQKLNRGMSLPEFKKIFYWEYGHRVLGRLIGLVYALPLFVFWAMGHIPSEFRARFLVALLLGGSQGLLGWFMVKSGLVDRPSVSHFRLAAHLCLALLILAYLFDLCLALKGRASDIRVPHSLRRLITWLIGLFVLQLIYGGFTAGLKAGLGFNTYPMMGDTWIAEAALTLVPFWHNLVENGAMIQFIHRWLGLLVLVVASVTLGLALSQKVSQVVKRAVMLCVGLLLVQFALGVTTLVTYVPLHWALSHQVFACFVVLGLTYLNFLTRSTAR